MVEQPRQILIDAYHEGLLDALLARLRAEGFGVGVQEVLQADALLHRCLAEDDPTLPRLRAILGPLLCIDEEQQRNFRKVFDDVARSLSEDARVDEGERPDVVLAGEKIHWNATWRAGAVALVTGLAVAAFGIWGRGTGPTEIPIETEPPTKQELPAPEPGAAIVPESAPAGPSPEPLPLPSNIVGRVIDLLGDPVSPARVELRARYGVPETFLPVRFQGSGLPIVSSNGEQLVLVISTTVFKRTIHETLLERHVLAYESGRAGIPSFALPDGSRVVAIESGTILTVGRDAPQFDGDWPRIYHTRNPAFLSASGRWVFETTAAGWKIHDVKNGAVRTVSMPNEAAARADVLAAQFSPDDGTIHVATQRGLLRVEWDPKSSGTSVIDELRSDAPITSARFSRSGSSVAYQMGDTGRIEARLGRHPLSLDAVGEGFKSFDVAEQRLLALEGDALTVLDADGAKHVDLFIGAKDAWISNDGRVVLVETIDALKLSPADFPEPVASAFARLDREKWAREPFWQLQVATDAEFRTVVVTSESSARRFRFRDVFEHPVGGEIQTRFARNTEPDPRTWLDVFVADPSYGAVEPVLFEIGGNDGAEVLEFRAELSPLPIGWVQFLGYRPGAVRSAVFAIPIAIGIGWWVRRRATRQAVLEARRPLEPPEIVREGFSATLDGLYRDAIAVRAGIEARRPRPLGLAELDPVATAQASAQRPGIFSPRFAPRMAMPGYLVLIDRRSVWDQLAKQMEEMIARLEDVGIAIARCDFDRDPRAVRGIGSGHRYTLSELASTLGGARLLLVSDGDGIFDRQSGAIARWAEIFAEWPERALLTPIEPCHWSRREAEITEQGFRVVAASPDGLLRFLESLTDHDAAERQPWEWSPPMPASLEEDAIGHLSRHIPDLRDADGLCDALRDYLGSDGYRWLCALAAYPALEWELTLYLGRILTAADGRPLQREDRLLRLARLPWLRYGQMPAWLRARLLADLPDADQQTVRAALAALLDGAEHSGASTFRLDFAFERRRRDTRRAGMQASETARAHERGDRLRDTVFISFLRGRRISPIDVRAPDRLRRLLFVEGRGAFGVRTGVGIAGAVLVGVVVSLVADRWLQRFRESPDRRPSAISNEWSKESGHLDRVISDVPADMTRVVLCGTPAQVGLSGPQIDWIEGEVDISANWRDSSFNVRIACKSSGVWRTEQANSTVKFTKSIVSAEPRVVAVAFLAVRYPGDRYPKEGEIVARMIGDQAQLVGLGSDRDPVPVDGEIRSLRGLDQAAVAGRVRRFPFLPAQGFAAHVTEAIEPDPSFISRLLRSVGLPSALSTDHIWTPDSLVDAIWAPNEGVPGFVTLSESGLASRWVDGAFAFTYGGPQESTSMDASLKADRLVTGGGGNARLWQLSDGKLLATIPGELPVRDVAISPDGFTIAVLRDKLSLWVERREDAAATRSVETRSEE